MSDGSFHTRMVLSALAVATTPGAYSSTAATHSECEVMTCAGCDGFVSSYTLMTGSFPATHKRSEPGYWKTTLAPASAMLPRFSSPPSVRM